MFYRSGHWENHPTMLATTAHGAILQRYVRINTEAEFLDDI
jgi:hypothetical protein